MKKFLSFALALMITGAFSLALSADRLPLPPSEATSSITQRDLRKHLSFLASDELGGRFSFSQSNRIAARYLASQLESYGYSGASRDGSFFQRVPLTRGAVDVTKSGITLTAGATAQQFEYEKDYMLETPADMPEYVKGEAVFVGYGISSPENKHDDYSRLDVKGKFVIAVKGAPESLKEAKLDDIEQLKVRTAQSRGAIGYIIISEGLLSGYATYSFGYAQRQFYKLPPLPSALQESIQVIQAGPTLVKAIAAALGKEESSVISPGGKPLAPVALPITLEIRTQFLAKALASTYNVVAVREGTDPILKNEYLVFSAHYDHLETGSNGDIYNGADDNASGVAAVLEIAEAFSVGPRPKRAILIALFTAEELGLRGSKFLTDYEPVVPLDKIVADFNLDMVGRSRNDTDSSNKDLTDKNTAFLLGADRSSELYNISETTNAETVRLQLDHTYKGPRGQVFRRSDHYNFDRHHIPAIWYHAGSPPEYHKPADDVDKIDFEKIERISKLAFATGWRVANLSHRLKVDKKPSAGN